MERLCDNVSFTGVNCSNNLTINNTFATRETPNSIEEFYYVYIGPCVILLGAVGNGLTYYVLKKPPLNALSTSVYIRTYALVSILFLIFIVGLDWFVHIFANKQFKEIIGSACRFYEFVSRIITYSGLWIINGATMDRCIKLWLPGTAQRICSVFQAKVVVLCIMLGLLLVSIHAIWMFSLDNQDRCVLDQTRYESFLWGWVSTVIYTLLPLAVLFLTCNLIFLRLCLKYRGQQLPDTNIEYDQTYVTSILAMVNFSLVLPATVIILVYQMRPEWRESLESVTIVSNHIVWICHTCLFFIHYFCCDAFRDCLWSIFSTSNSCVDFGSTMVESPMTVDEYTQVPSLTTEL